MDHKRTMHIEFQSSSYGTTADLEQLIGAAVSVVLEHAAMYDGHERDNYTGDRTTTKGWASIAAANDRGVTRLAEQERLNGLIDDLEVKYSEPFVRHGSQLPWNENFVDDVADEETLLAEARRAEEFALRGGELG